MDSNGLFIMDDCTTKVEQSSSFLSPDSYETVKHHVCSSINNMRNKSLVKYRIYLLRSGFYESKGKS